MNESKWRRLWFGISKLWELCEKAEKVLQAGGSTYIWRWMTVTLYFEADERLNPLYNLN